MTPGRPNRPRRKRKAPREARLTAGRNGTACACFAPKIAKIRPWRSTARFSLARRLRPHCAGGALEDSGAASGLYNVGSGIARSFLDKAKIMFEEMSAEPNVEFLDLPVSLRGKYQSYTCVSMDKAREASFAARPASRMA